MADAEQLLGLGLGRAVDVDLGLDDRHQAGGDDLAADLELLVDDGLRRPASLATLMTERILVPKIPLSLARASSSSRPGIGFITWAPSASSARPLSTLRNGHDPLDLPQVLRGVPAVDLAVHGHLEQDRGQDAVAAEGGAGHDPGPHLVDEVEHLARRRSRRPPRCRTGGAPWGCCLRSGRARRRSLAPSRILASCSSFIPEPSRGSSRATAGIWYDPSNGAHVRTVLAGATIQAPQGPRRNSCARVSAVTDWVVDLDGVMWRGRVPITGSADAVGDLLARGDRVLFCTNNSAESGEPSEPHGWSTRAIPARLRGGHLRRRRVHPGRTGRAGARPRRARPRAPRWRPTGPGPPPRRTSTPGPWCAVPAIAGRDPWTTGPSTWWWSGSAREFDYRRPRRRSCGRPLRGAAAGLQRRHHLPRRGRAASGVRLAGGRGGGSIGPVGGGGGQAPPRRWCELIAVPAADGVRGGRRGGARRGGRRPG